MKTFAAILLVLLIKALSGTAQASQADDTAITISGQAAGPTPFIAQLTLIANDTTVINSIRFTVTPKPGSVTRALSGTYSSGYLTDRGYLNPDTGEIFLPVYGLYADYTNTVTLTYLFKDGSSGSATVPVLTEPFDDPCGYEDPTVLQARTNDTSLSFDYFMVKGQCSTFSPAIIDSDSHIRWVGSASLASFSSTFFDNAAYVGENSALYRLDLDGTVTELHDYSDIGVTGFHHNIDYGKTGIILDVDTDYQTESVNIEVDASGNVTKMWNLASIIGEAMSAGGDDPDQFVYPPPTDWFHNNAVAYNRADDSLVVSSRENFLIGIDYESGAIRWIFGDPTKKWYKFNSLRSFTISAAPDTLAPIGQHAPSITFDQHLLLFDNGLYSGFQMPPGALRNYASPRRYHLDFGAMLATEVWNHEMDQSIYSPICGSIYEDAPYNYLIDYANVNGPNADNQYVRIEALNAAEQRIFYYQYPTSFCDTAFNAIPLHLESTSFPAVDRQSRNLSTRGVVGNSDQSLIAGFIVTGPESKTVTLRVLGPSLAGSGLSDLVADPVLTLFDAAGSTVATNDDWQSDPNASQIIAEGLAPSNPTEAATVQSLAPGAYTLVVSGKDTAGVGLVEAYDVAPIPDSNFANLSTRGFVGTGDKVLITGFILGDVGSSTVVLRALGPSLTSLGITDALPDPELTIYDPNGSAISSNDSWREDPSADAIIQNGLAPGGDLEAATILHLPPGAYSAIVRGVAGGTGIALAEIYNLE